MRVKTRQLSLPIINSTVDMFRSAPHAHSVAESAKGDAEFDSVRDLRLKLQSSQEEITKLQAVITDLTQVNKRWQKYNNDRQIYVQKLLNTIQDQQEQLNHIGERSFSSSSAQSSSSGNVNNDSEIDRYRAIEQKLKEKVSILEFQVKAHRDDWEAELNEKKQVLKDKDAVELKLAELIARMQALNSSGECRESRIEMFCQNCGQLTGFDQTPPSRSGSRTYRTAVHLPCSSSRHSSTTSISTTGDAGELVIDSKMLKKPDEQLESANIWNIKADDTSYSRSSTVPLVARPATQSSPSSAATTTHSSSSSVSVGWNPVTVKSYVQIPISKSSSVPEGNCASKLPELPRMSLDSFKYSANVPPVSVINSAEQYTGVETLSAENVICLRCGEVFPPDMHLKFLDHFPKCQSNRNQNTSSRDGLPKV